MIFLSAMSAESTSKRVEDVLFSMNQKGKEDRENVFPTLIYNVEF